MTSLVMFMTSRAISRPYVGTWELNASFASPPYDRRLFSFVPGFHEGGMQRDRKCSQDLSWRYQWRPAGSASPMTLLDADGAIRVRSSLALVDGVS